MIWLILLSILLLLMLLPVGIRGAYDKGAVQLWLRIGPVTIRLLPRPQNREKQSKPEPVPAQEQAPKASAPEPQAPPPAPQEDEKKDLRQYLPLLRLLGDLLKDLRRKIRMDRLYVRLILAGGDPCDLAVSYGRTWAAVGNLLPLLDQLFVIKKRDVEVACDFSAAKTILIARADVTILLGRLLGLAAVYGVRALKEYWNLQKNQKGGAENE